MAVFENTSGQRRYLEIADVLAKQIIDGGYEEGQRLKAERELAAEHSVSRTTIREALLALEIMKFVDIRVGAGVYVQPQSRWAAQSNGSAADNWEAGPHEILDARRTIEPRTAYLAAEHGTPEQIEKLEASVDEMAANINSVAAFDQSDERFHLTIAEASANTLLQEIVIDLWSRRRGSMWGNWYDKARSVSDRRRAVEDHRHILNAIKTKRPQAAQVAMHAHIDVTVSRFLEADLDPVAEEAME